MSGVQLRRVCEQLGLCNVQSILASGNLVFESDQTNAHALEAILEEAWSSHLGFKSTTILKSQKELQQLIDHDPFHGLTHGSSSYLLATFFKHPKTLPFVTPHQPAGKPYKIIGCYDNVLFSVTDNTVVKTTDLMTWLEKQFGKDITSRTWNTVRRIHQKLSM